MREKLLLNAEEFRSAAEAARRTAGHEVFGHHHRGEELRTPPHSRGTSPPRRGRTPPSRSRGATPPRTKVPRTSSELSSKAAYGSTHEPDCELLYDSGPTSSPRGKAGPISPIVKLSTSINEVCGPAAKRWDADQMHRFIKKDGEIAKAAIRDRRPASLPATIYITALSSREDARRLLKETQLERFYAKGFDGCRDDCKTLLHPVRFMPAPHLSPPDLFQLGVAHYKEYRPLPAYHDVTHLKAGGMVDDRAYIRANNLSDGALRLEVFRPT